MSKLIRAISENGGIVLCAIDSTDIVREMERIHQPNATVAAALGRLLTGASLMGIWLKEDESELTLRLDGGGPAGVLIADSDEEGNVRGYADHPRAEDPPLNANGKLDVGAVVGKTGTLTVRKRMSQMGESYSGQTELVSGEVAEDITSYYATSEQTPTVCALGVLVNPDLTIRSAGGYLMQLLPGATDAEITQLENNIAKMPPVSELLEKGGTVYDMMNIALEGFAPEILDEREVAYRCNCTKESVEEALLTLPEEDLEQLLAEDPFATVECHYCDKRYKIDLAKLLAEKRQNS